MARILVVDNYDSFTYNLVHYLEGMGAELTVLRNDHPMLMAHAELSEGIVLSPGPGLPAEAGQMPELIRRFAGVKSILGICLGCQALGEHYGASLENLPEVYHGVQHSMHQERESALFKGVPDTFPAGRYHSWVLSSKSLSADMQVLVCDQDGQVMAWQHAKESSFAIQFHPESVMTPDGRTILKNWLEITKAAAVRHLYVG